MYFNFSFQVCLLHFDIFIICTSFNSDNINENDNDNANHCSLVNFFRIITSDVKINLLRWKKYIQSNHGLQLGLVVLN